MVQRVHAFLRERLALVSRLGWIAHIHDQGVRTRVQNRNHIIHRAHCEDLRFVEHGHVHAVQSSAETVLAGAEHDAAAGRERDLLLAVCSADAFHVPAEHWIVLHLAHVRECLVAGARMVGGPDGFQVRCEYRLEEQRSADGEGLADLPAAGQHGAVRATRVLAFRVLSEQKPQETLLPQVETDAGLARSFVDSRELAADDAFRLAENLGDFRQSTLRHRPSPRLPHRPADQSNRRPGAIRYVRIRR